MARWNKGSEVIERLLEDRHLAEIPAYADTVDRLIATTRRHIESATTNTQSDPEGALALAYDAARKAPLRCWPIRVSGPLRPAVTSRSSRR